MTTEIVIGYETLTDIGWHSGSKQYGKMFFLENTFLLVQILYLMQEVYCNAHEQLTEYNTLKCNSYSVTTCATSPGIRSFNVSSKSQCVDECQRQRGRQKNSSCIGVNYRPQNNRCDTFDVSLVNYSINIPDCLHITVINSINALNWRQHKTFMSLDPFELVDFIMWILLALVGSILTLSAGDSEEANHQRFLNKFQLFYAWSVRDSHNACTAIKSELKQLSFLKCVFSWP